MSLRLCVLVGCYYYYKYFFFFFLANSAPFSCWTTPIYNYRIILREYRVLLYSPTPLFWSISKSFLMLSSLDCNVCFWVSILSSNSCGPKSMALKVRSSDYFAKRVSSHAVTLIVSLRIATSRVKWSFSFNNSSTCCCNSILGPRILIRSSSSSWRTNIDCF